MLQRFQGEEGRRLLIEALKSHRLVGGSAEIASAIADVGSVREVPQSEVLIREGNSDNGIFFILAGNFTVGVKRSPVATRGAGDHVGDIAAINPGQRRSATVVADEDGIVVELSEPDLAEIADQHPSIWRALAVDLARRLVQRNRLVTAVNDQARVFIISSVEALHVANEIQKGLSYEDVLPVVWTNGVFKASEYPVEGLEAELDKADFAIAVAHADDATEVRGQIQPTPRDNVIFELGFFMGRLGRQRTILVEPREENVKLPSDLTGLTVIGYRDGAINDLPALLGPACTEIIKIIRALGPQI